MITPAFADIVLELIIEEVPVTPLTIDVNSLTAEERAFWLMKLAVVVEVTPFTVDERVKELVEVETVNTLVVPAFMIDWRSVDVATPFTIEVSIVPLDVKLLELIIDEVEIDPPMLEVIVLEAEDKVFGTSKLVTERLVVVPEFAVKLLRVAVLVDVKLLVVRLVPVALSKIRDDIYAERVLKISVKKLVVVAFVIDALVEKRLVEVELVSIALVIVADPKIGLSVKM